MTVRTLADLVFHVREVAAGRPHLLSGDAGGRREALSTTDFLRNVHGLALALEERDVGGGDRVAILSENRPEWLATDLACQLLGVTTVPIDPALEAERVAYLLRNSGSRFVFYSDAAKRDLLVAIRDSLTTTPVLVAFDGDAAAAPGGSLTRLLGAVAERRARVPLERFRGRVAPDDVATLVYTSGADGDPAGVGLSHGELVSRLLAVVGRLGCGPGDVALSFLPLAGLLQRTVDAACLHGGAAIAHLASAERVPAALHEMRPTLLTAPPELYARAHAEMLRAAEADELLRRRLFAWALAVGRRHAAARRGVVRPLLGIRRRLADALVHRHLRARFGGRLRVAVSAGPVPAESAEFFAAIGLPLRVEADAAETAPAETTAAVSSSGA